MTTATPFESHPDRPNERPEAGADKPPARGNTWKSQQGDAAPRQSHEHDQSADSQQGDNPSADEVGQQAYEDVTSGKKDTDRGPVVDQVYKRQT